MSSAVTTGVFALGGVVVGGVLNPCLTHLLQGRVDQRSARTTARLALIEVSEARHLLLDAQHEQTWRLLADLKLSDWQEHRAVLAGAMEGDDWIKAWSGERALREAAGRAPAPFHQGDDERAQDADKAVARFTNVLIDISVDGPRWRRARWRRRLRARLPRPLRSKPTF